jgi:hypothetical protein
MKKACTVCLANGIRKSAEFVAGDSTSLMWFECTEHGPTDNVAGVLRTRLDPLEEFFKSIGISLAQLEELEEPCPPTERD